MQDIFSPRDNFRPFEYPEAYEFWKQQVNHPWSPDQIDVNSDVQNYHTSFTEAEKHGINTVLKLFTNYETNVEDYWISVIYKWFPKHEIRMMASAFASMETVHATFYDKLNEALNLSTKEFYLSFTKDKHMVARMDKIQEWLYVDNKEDLPISLAAFSFVEGVILYSSFAFLLSFPKRNKLDSVATGLAYSVRDENIHASADSWLFNTVLKENGWKLSKYRKEIVKMAKTFYAIEEKIIDNIFSAGRIENITEHQLKNFVKSRIDKKLKDIGIDPIYEVKYNPIADWFYTDINATEFSDFFFVNPSAYSHKWGFNGIKY